MCSQCDWRTRVLSFATLVCLCAGSQTVQSNPWDEVVNLVVRTSPSANVSSAVEAVEAPSYASVHAGDDLRDVLVRRCGDLTSDLQVQARALNAGMISSTWRATGDGLFRVPTCLKSFRNATIPVPEHSTPAQEIVRVTGSADPDTRALVTKQNPQIAGKVDSKPQAGEAVTYAEVPAFTTIQLTAKA